MTQIQKKNEKILFETEYNLFEKLVYLVKKEFKNVLLTMILIAIGAMGYLMYKQLEYQQTLILSQQKITGAVIPNETGAVLKKFSSDKRIDNILSDLRVAIDADRTKLFQYHNNVSSVNGNKFLYIGATNEIDKTGISKELANLQTLPSSQFNTTIDNYLKNSADICFTKEKLLSTETIQYFEAQGIITSCTWVIKSTNDIIGIITINYNDTRKPNIPDIKDQLKIASIRIADVLKQTSGGY